MYFLVIVIGLPFFCTDDNGIVWNQCSIQRLGRFITTNAVVFVGFLQQR